MAEQQQKALKRTQQGVVTSNKMDKTAVVRITRQEKHPMYKKYVRLSSKFHVHDPKNECQIGDVVVIAEGRPRSKMKSWELVNIVTRAK